MLRHRPLSFRAEALQSVQRIRPGDSAAQPFLVSGSEYIPPSGPCLLVANHYTRPGFKSWWLVLSISALVPFEVHWVVSAGWNFAGRQVARLTRVLFPRMARVYGFTAMPPMPPDPEEVIGRAIAIRQVLNYLRTAPQPVVGLMPEGEDEELGILKMPHPGTGRFMLLLAQSGLEVVPAGIYEAAGSLCVRFGPHIYLDTGSRLAAVERDRQASCQVMCAIAGLLPEGMRGAFGR
ncbi:MAG TPA: hypothetical protein VN363_07570 [Anaerolineales bacterium]|nr:hypothetical protein [Anaerolineales bacterium]